MKRSRSTARLFEAGLSAARRVYVFVAVLLSLAYAVSGMRIVEPGDVGLVRRFGRWVHDKGVIQINRPGLLFAWPAPIDEVVRLPLQQEIAINIAAFHDERPEPAPPSIEGDAESSSPDDDAPGNEPSDDENSQPLPVRYVLTGDRNILQLKAIAKFRIIDPAVYATTFHSPKQAVEKVVSSAITGTLSEWSIDEALRLQRDSQSLSEVVLSASQELLKATNLGAELTTIEFGEVVPPEQTRRSFLAVHEARVDQDAWREEAVVESAEQLLTAETLAQQFIADARGKQSSRAALANQEVALFQAALASSVGPLQDTTWQRLRHETWRELMRNAKQVLVVPKSDKHGVLRLSLPELEKSR